jgi:hypothetical protein
VSYFSRPEEVLVEWRDRLDSAKGLLGLTSVILGEGDLLMEYPCCQIIGEPVTRQFASTQFFQVFFQMAVWVYHAGLDESHQQRTIEDMELATGVVRFLHEEDNRHLRDENNENRLIFSYVLNELPGRIRRVGSPDIITTRILWQGESRILLADS